MYIFIDLGILLRSCLKLMHNFQWYDGQPYTFLCILLAVSLKNKVSMFVYKIYFLYKLLKRFGFNIFTWLLGYGRCHMLLTCGEPIRINTRVEKFIILLLGYFQLYLHLLDSPLFTRQTPSI